MAAALAVGWAYSLPPLRLKRFPARRVAVRSAACAASSSTSACGCTSRARSADSDDDRGPVWALTAFVLPFSLRDRDPQGRPRHRGRQALRHRTFTVRFGRRAASRVSASPCSSSPTSAWRCSAPPCSTTVQRAGLGARARRGARGAAALARGVDPRDARRVHAASTCGSGPCSSPSTRSSRSRRSAVSCRRRPSSRRARRPRTRDRGRSRQLPSGSRSSGTGRPRGSARRPARAAGRARGASRVRCARPG